MVDKLRKISNWLLANAWRLTLMVVVGYLSYRVYVVVSPPEPPEYRRLRAPQRDLTQVPPEGKPPKRTLAPPLDITGGYGAISRSNPFWFHSNPSAQKKNTGDILQEMGVQVKSIREVGGRLRAQIRTASTKKWYDEGEQFEEFELREINQAEGTVRLYLTRDGKTYTLSVEQ